MFKSTIYPQPFIATFPEQTLGTSGVATPTINFANDCDFEIQEIRAVIRKETPGTPFDAPVTMSMETLGGLNWQMAAVDLLSIASVQTDQFSGKPIELKRPTRIPANSQIKFTLNNQSTTVSVYVQVMLIGFKVKTVNNVQQ